MQTVYSSLLILHIIAGTISLISGTAAFLARKGKGRHAQSGSLFYYAMLAVGFSALILSSLKFNPFLFIVGLFSLYLTITGYRSLHTHAKSNPPDLQTDWAIWGLTLIGTITFLIFNIFHQPGELAPVLFIFSFFLLSMLWEDFRAFRKKEWNYQGLLKRHISRMGGAFIATVTAFIVTNIQLEPAFVLWLLPTAFITPVLIYYQNQWAKKLKKRNNA